MRQKRGSMEGLREKVYITKLPSLVDSVLRTIRFAALYALRPARIIPMYTGHTPCKPSDG